MRRACFQSLRRHIFNGLFTGEEFSDWSTTIVVMAAFDSGQLASLWSLTEVFGSMCLILGEAAFFWGSTGRKSFLPEKAFTVVLSGVSSGNGSIKKNKTNFTDRADAHPTLIRERTPWCRPDSPPIRHDAKRIRLITPPKALSSLGRKSDPLYTSGLTLAFSQYCPR